MGEKAEEPIKPRWASSTRLSRPSGPHWRALVSNARWEKQKHKLNFAARRAPKNIVHAAAVAHRHQWRGAGQRAPDRVQGGLSERV
ncbi:hypothetical protein BJS_07511 [Bradyrhizobium japonicum SEMIA 5079]|jgi:hypothetical protein|uniref:Uncharacterized protein n=1 Tax=Bradyrhizobium diazoefficiens SEMIA 5080 TaxID=754504 RepID=A0A837CEM1_9BRAD|nr:hypothetical protein BJS_07511 [Bradyrhizobium japonicum SEMIA 5079]KGJ67391.1 hypothetical protein BJA5080_07747 [Bradyrhizobium diazoefficiens SEMIA 5080]